MNAVTSSSNFSFPLFNLAKEGCKRVWNIVSSIFLKIGELFGFVKSSPPLPTPKVPTRQNTPRSSTSSLSTTNDNLPTPSDTSEGDSITVINYGELLSNLPNAQEIQTLADTQSGDKLEALMEKLTDADKTAIKEVVRQKGVWLKKAPQDYVTHKVIFFSLDPLIILRQLKIEYQSGPLSQAQLTAITEKSVWKSFRLKLEGAISSPPNDLLEFFTSDYAESSKEEATRAICTAVSRTSSIELMNYIFFGSLPKQ